MSDTIARGMASIAKYHGTLLRSDFLSAGVNQQDPWSGAALASGTSGGWQVGTAKHPGILTYKSSTNANSGYMLYTDPACVLLGGGEKSTIIFAPSATLETITRRMGFHDTSDQNEPVDGVYVEILEGVLTGKTANNSTRSTTASNYTVSASTWYRLVIELNTTATLATYTLYADDSNTVLWTDTLATNIPTGAGRNTSHRDIATSSGTTAIEIASIDYIDIYFPNARRVV